SSGAPLHPEDKANVRARLCRNLFDYYGTTEGGGISILAPTDRELGEGSVGRPVFMVDVEIVDNDDHPLPRGEVGRIRYRGPGVATADTEAAGDYAGSTHADGWFYPGDLGLLDANGFLHLRGRQKDVIVRGGVNVYPLEIEQTLLQLDNIADAAVVAWPSAEFGEEIAAFVVARRDGIDIGSIERQCQDRLAPYKLPRQIYLVDDLPRNSSGKVLKTRLQERLVPIE
ncbi:MAG: fatty acid--CoA ligase family protein, partial [Pseudomonadota bacterium]